MCDLLVQALKSLPHGAEFRFVDRLLSLEPGRQGTGQYRVRGDEPFLPGHFPGDPLLPGVLLVEAAAQLAEVVVRSDPALAPRPGLRLTALRNVKLLGSAGPGEVVTLEVRITGRADTLIQAEGRAEVNGRTVLTAELTLGGG